MQHRKKPPSGGFLFLGLTGNCSYDFLHCFYIRLGKGMDDTYHLQRFVDAQLPVYPQVCNELRVGRKTSHWMWFIFPQIAGLGHSAMARHYAISSLAEARDYLEHPLLG